MSPERRARFGSTLGGTPLDTEEALDTALDLGAEDDSMGDSGAWYGSASETEFSPPRRAGGTGGVPGCMASGAPNALPTGIVVRTGVGLGRCAAGSSSKGANTSPPQRSPQRSSPLRPATAAVTSAVASASTAPSSSAPATARPSTAAPSLGGDGHGAVVGAGGAAASSCGCALSSSLLLARARASGGLGGCQLLSVEDLDGSDDDFDGAGAGTASRPGMPGTAPPRPVPLASAPRERLSDFRSTFANPRDEEGRLHWPPRELDAALDKLLDECPLPSKPDGRTAAERTASRRRHRGFAPDAALVFELELERQLTDLVTLLVMEEHRADGGAPAPYHSPMVLPLHGLPL